MRERVYYIAHGIETAILGQQQEEIDGDPAHPIARKNRPQRSRLNFGREHRASDEPLQIGARIKQRGKHAEAVLGLVKFAFVAGELKEGVRITPGHARH